MKQHYYSHQLLFLLISVLFTLCVWVGFDVYRAFTVVPPVEDTEELLQSLSPTLNTQVLVALEQRSP